MNKELIARLQKYANDEVRDLPTENMDCLFDDVIAALSQPQVQRELERHQPCGCVVCTCEDLIKCQGCGAKECGTHPVGKIPNPIYAHPQPAQDAAIQQEPVAKIEKSEGGYYDIEDLPGTEERLPYGVHLLYLGPMDSANWAELFKLRAQQHPNKESRHDNR